MTELKLTVPEVGEKNSVADPRTQVALEAIRTFINGAQLTSGNIKEHGIEEGSLAEALQSKIGAKLAGLTANVQNGSFVASSGELVVQEKEGASVTLPAAVANRVVGVAAGANGVKVKATGSTIFGDFIEAAPEITLQKSQHVLLQCVSTNWFITAGEPKREEARTTGTLTTGTLEGAGFEPSALRPALTIMTVTFQTGKVGRATLTVGGVTVAVIQAPTVEGETSVVPVTIPTQTGETIKGNTLNNVAALKYCTLPQ
jgi:hypothetical protein